MKVNHGLEQDFNSVAWAMKSRKDAALVKKLWARVQQVLGIYESLLDSKVNAAIDEAEKGKGEEEEKAAGEASTDSPKEEEQSHECAGEAPSMSRYIDSGVYLLLSIYVHIREEGEIVNKLTNCGGLQRWVY